MWLQLHAVRCTYAARNTVRSQLACPGLALVCMLPPSQDEGSTSTEACEQSLAACTVLKSHEAIVGCDEHKQQKSFVRRQDSAGAAPRHAASASRGVRVT